ncbi:hypothetical protein CLU79DRAFT_837112 [Phycomyces nitens]|nr:hypothetical protein CLU79DRAFT_837112 [Phycomyces nitens]
MTLLLVFIYLFFSLQTSLAAISGDNTTISDIGSETDLIDGDNSGSINYTTGGDLTKEETPGAIDITDIISSTGRNHEAQGRQAIARVIVDRNTTAVILFEQDGDSVKYDFFVALSGSSDGCISWDATIAPSLNPRSNECPTLTDPVCLKTMKPNICTAGQFGFGECGTGQGKTGIKLGSHKIHSNTAIDSGRTSAFNIFDNDPNTVIGRRQDGRPAGLPEAVPDIPSGSAYVPLENGVSAIFQFKQYPEDFEYSLLFDSPNAEGSCLSWAIGFPSNDNGTNLCTFLENPSCMTLITKDMCKKGLHGFGYCGQVLGSGAIPLDGYDDQRQLVIDSGRGTGLNILSKDSHDVIGKALMIIYSPKKGAPQQVACGNIQKDKSALLNPDIPEASETSGSTKKNIQLGNALIAGAALYAVGL